MRVLWLTWKDHNHPGAGGAEIVLHELSKRLIAEGHEVTWLTCDYPGASAQGTLDGIHIIRVGKSRYAHPLQALTYYIRRLRGQYDIVIEVVNTAPYFSVFFGRKTKHYLFYHQLAREIWFHETSPPLSHVGYLLEPLLTRLLARSGAPLITVSDSTLQDLQRYGFSPKRSAIISEGIEINPVANLDAVKKYTQPTLLSFGAMRAMKRTLDQIEAYELAKRQLPELRLQLAGSTDGLYAQKVLTRVARSPHCADIEVLGHVSKQQKIKLMQKSHLILQTALKEGWGLTITEAASQGTPAVAYNVDGLRDSVRDGGTGRVVPQNPRALAETIVTLLKAPELYKHMCQAAWRWSKQITFEQSYQDFKRALELT